MMRVSSAVAVIGLLLSACGCVPYLYTDRPHVTGRVTNLETGLPLSGAEVSIYSGSLISDGKAKTITEMLPNGDYSRTPEATILTDREGRFELAAVRQWGIWIIPQDFYFRPWKVTAAARGYTPSNIYLRHFVNDGAVENVREVKLRPLSTSQP